MTASADLYFSARSPYSYLAIQMLDRVMPGHQPAFEIQLKPVMPLAVRMPEIFKKVNPLGLPYLEQDVRRLAEMRGIDLRIWPVPDPIAQDMKTLEVASEQPYIWRITRLIYCAVEKGCGFEFAVALSRLIWTGEVDNWHEGDHIEKVAESVGLSLAEMEVEIEADQQRIDDALFANQDALGAAGHWGVPTVVFDGEPFFGQDRLDVFLWRLKQKCGTTS